MRTTSLSLLSQGLRREVIVGRRAVAAVGVAATVACLTLAAYARLYLPFTPVPLTLQTFFVLVAGVAMGPRLGALSFSAYLVLGSLGLPIFAGSWLGPTTGYLVGFAVAGWTVAALAPRGARTPMRRLVLAMLAGTAVIYLFGAGWLAIGLGLGLGKAVAVGIVPFVVGDLIKLAAAVAFIRGYRSRLLALFPSD